VSLKLDKLNYIYNEGTTLESYAVKDVSFEIDKGEFVGIIGRTGSGKSTLIQHFNGLLKATRGAVLFDGKNVAEKGYNIKGLRQKVGLVFQYPEYQLFEETVLQDVMYGPKNQGLDEATACERAKEAIRMVGLDSTFYSKSPFEISGGQKRRVAIAGVLAMKPEYLVLDEPTAGLDPRGRDEILDMIAELRKETGIAVILVSHSMEDVAKYVDRLLVLNKGEIMYDATPKEVFRHVDELEKIGLSAPQMVFAAKALREAGYALPEDLINVDEVADELIKLLKVDQSAQTTAVQK